MVCYDAYKNLYVESHYGGASIAPCCVTKPVKVEKINFVKDRFLQNVRQQFDQGHWPDSCGYCKKIEDSDELSRRQGSNHWYQDNSLDNTTVEFVRLDYWVGDLCNLACAICGPDYSSVWKQRLQIPIEQRKTVVNDFWQDLDLDQLRYVHFNGGEPLLNQEHVRFLQALPNKSQTVISYNTNGTVRPSDKLKNLWLEFKLVEVVFSIDDIGARFEYQRWPAKWDQVKENLQWYIDQGNHNSMYAVNTTVSWLNKHSLPQLSQWLAENFACTQFTDPIDHRQQPVNGPLALTNHLSAVTQYLDRVDALRGTDWRAVFPELSC